MEEHVETLKLEDGLTARIVHDPDCERPFQNDDGVRIVVLHGKYRDPSEGACGRTPDEVARWERDNPDWYSAPLWLYDHSGVAYAAAPANPFSCPWDSGRVGIVALKRSEWGTGDLADAELARHANEVAVTYGQWANGECYGYSIVDADGNAVDSCSGYVGLDAAIDAARQASPARPLSPAA